ncbi:hypothetical protein [Ideonella paludis]|uniref:hypothetical protein n=1 Tax=Ideonella paludis TaxID=1233411 RepID=UPI00363DC22A
MNTALTTRLATGADLPELAGLFDAHRQFHELPSDVPAVRAFWKHEWQAVRHASVWRSARAKVHCWALP